MHSLMILPLLSVAGSLSSVQAAGTGLPRGVGPEFAKFYPISSSAGFSCISHPHISLTYAQLNDDYCDCPDGSDEPGTAACAHISPLSPHTMPHPNASDLIRPSGHVLPGFYCANAGHNPAYVPFAYVNDGVCDSSICCDGSDEWAQVGGTKCANRCAEIGKEWRRLDEARKTSLARARDKRQELVDAAHKKRKEIEASIKDARVQIEAAEIKVKKAKEELADEERKEARRVAKGTGAGGKVGVLAGLAKGRIAEMRAALGRVLRQRDGMLDRVVELENILSTFKDEYNPNFNDEGVKRAVRAWEEYAARDTSDDPGLHFDRAGPEEKELLEMVDGGDSADGIDWTDFESGEGSSDADDDVAALYDLASYLPPTLREWLSSQLSSLRALLVENGILSEPATKGKGTSESKVVREARTRLSTAENTLRSSQTSLKNHEEDLARGCGPNDVFRTMKDKCISMDSGEYTYEVCWMDKVTQRSKKGGGHQNMGSFDRFETEYVDEELPADGRGLGTGERITMRFERGSHCWNGPARSTTVVLGCSENEEVIKVVEEAKCVYRVEALTPAVCGNESEDSTPQGQEGRKLKDEL